MRKASAPQRNASEPEARKPTETSKARATAAAVVVLVLSGRMMMTSEHTQRAEQRGAAGYTNINQLLCLAFSFRWRVSVSQIDYTVSAAPFILKP